MSASLALVKSAARAFELLEVFARARQPLRLTDLVAALGLPRSSVAALLKSMQTQGYLNFDQRSRRYLPSARLAGLVSWIPAASFEAQTVLPAMHRLQHATGELVVLGTPRGIHLEYVESVRATEPIQLYIAPGTTRLLVQNSGGWMLLARGPEAAAMAIYHQTIAAGELSAAEFPLKRFRARLAAHRGLDISFSTARDYVRPTAHWGGALFAALLPVPPGHRALVVGIGGLTERLAQKRERITAALRQEIDHIAATLDVLPDQDSACPP